MDYWIVAWKRAFVQEVACPDSDIKMLIRYITVVKINNPFCWTFKYKAIFEIHHLQIIKEKNKL